MTKISSAINLLPESSNIMENPFLTGLSDLEKSELQKHVVIRDFKRNEVILNENDSLNYLYLIISGELKVIQLSAEGKEHIIAIHKKGDFFGEMGLLDGKTTPATIVALKDCRICLITRESFSKIIMSNTAVVKNIIDILCLRLRQAWLQIRAMSFEDAEDRIRFALKELGEKFGIRDNRGLIINFGVTHQNIADLSKTSRETVSRFFSRAERAEEIEILADKKILLKKQFQ
jgi:CRP/FNR family transcriptional regulator